MNTLSSILKFIEGYIAPFATNQTANKVLASPNGSSGKPTFRSLVEADIPSLSAAKITSGSMSADRIGSGTLADARIPSLAAGKITSGTFTVGAFSTPVTVGGYKMLTVEAFDIDNITVSGGNYNESISKTITKTGYTPIGVIGYAIVNASSSGTRATYCFPTRIRLATTTTVGITVRNTSSSDAKIRIYFDVLYVAPYTDGTELHNIYFINRKVIIYENET